MRLETQERLMASQSLAELVTRDLRLDRNPTFMGSAPPSQMSAADVSRRIGLAADKLHEATEITRKPQTQLSEVGVTTASPKLSAMS